jgi:hypothetical protein
MKIIEAGQAPIFEETNEFGEPIVTHVFGVTKIMDLHFEYIYDVKKDKDVAFGFWRSSLPESIKPEPYDLKRYCEGMAKT